MGKVDEAQQKKDLDSLQFIDQSFYRDNLSSTHFFHVPLNTIQSAEKILRDKSIKKVAYFSMEFGLAPSVYNTYVPKGAVSELNQKRSFEIFSNFRQMDYYHVVKVDTLVDLPIYSGGLGVLAGDSLKSSADLKLPLIGVGILWNKGYFDQKFCFHFGQMPGEFQWSPENYPGLVKLNQTIAVDIGSQSVSFNLWKYYVPSYDLKHVVPLLLLDSNHPDNDDWAKQLTNQLYKSDNLWWKIVQRKILGIGGVKALEKLGYQVDILHLNEGHAALAFVEKAKGLSEANLKKLMNQFAYTCHTPVEAGHDRLPIVEMVKVLSGEELALAKRFGQDHNSELINLTMLAMNTAKHVNAVAMKHEEVTKLQFPKHKQKIQGITNGIHVPTWISKSMSDLFDEYADTFGDWRANQGNLAKVKNLKNDREFRRKLWIAHKVNKKILMNYLKQWFVSENVFTIAWARRAAPYKRPSLILQYPEILLELSQRVGRIQILFAGKAHPNDFVGSGNIKEILTGIDNLSSVKNKISVLFLENYDTYIGKLLTSSVDVWLNNPLPPFEASGTSGMKAILNGVLQLSTLDGWVVEAVDQDIGAIFGYRAAEGTIGDEHDLKLTEDAHSLYKTMETLISHYYAVENEHNEEIKYDAVWIDQMINCIAASAFFNTDRMIGQYNSNIWEMKPIKT